MFKIKQLSLIPIIAILATGCKPASNPVSIHRDHSNSDSHTIAPAVPKEAAHMELLYSFIETDKMTLWQESLTQISSVVLLSEAKQKGKFFLAQGKGAKGEIAILKNWALDIAAGSLLMHENESFLTRELTNQKRFNSSYLKEDRDVKNSLIDSSTFYLTWSLALYDDKMNLLSVIPFTIQDKFAVITLIHEAHPEKPIATKPVVTPEKPTATKPVVTPEKPTATTPPIVQYAVSTESEVTSLEAVPTTVEKIVLLYSLSHNIDSSYINKIVDRATRQNAELLFDAQKTKGRVQFTQEDFKENGKIELDLQNRQFIYNDVAAPIFRDARSVKGNMKGFEAAAFYRKDYDVMTTNEKSMTIRWYLEHRYTDGTYKVVPLTTKSYVVHESEE